MSKGITIGELIGHIDSYIEQKRDELPILKECCLENRWDYNWLMDKAETSPRLRQAVERLLNQREVNLERGGVLGGFNKQMAALLWRESVADNARKDVERGVLRRLDALLRADVSAAASLNTLCNISDEDDTQEEEE